MLSYGVSIEVEKINIKNIKILFHAIIIFLLIFIYTLELKKHIFLYIIILYKIIISIERAKNSNWPEQMINKRRNKY